MSAALLQDPSSDTRISAGLRRRCGVLFVFRSDHKHSGDLTAQRLYMVRVD